MVSSEIKAEIKAEIPALIQDLELILNFSPYLTPKIMETTSHNVIQRCALLIESLSQLQTTL